MTRIRRAAAAMALAAGALVAGATAAAAHAILLGTTPADGSVLRSSPSRVSLRFDEAVGRPAYVTVTGPSGRVDAGSAVVQGVIVSVPIRPASHAGAYTVAYRVVSDDGHPVEGTFAYRVGAAASTPSGTTSSQPAASPGPSPPAGTSGVAARATTTDSGAQGGTHWFAVLAGIAVVLAGGGALLWERLNRRTAGDDPAP
jgi:copper resistance protein C